MEEFKNLKEIIELSEEEINNNDENVSAVLDLVDLKELRNLIARYKELEKYYQEEKVIWSRKDYIPKSKVKEKIEDYTEKSKHPLVNAQSRREYTFGIKALQELLEES